MTTGLLKLLEGRNLSLAVAESLTGGHLQALITATPGMSARFEGGITAYQLSHKARLLGVDPLHAESCNSVSERVATDMAVGACKLFNCTLGVATTGYAQPDPTHHITAPFAWWALAHIPRDAAPQIQAFRVDGHPLTRVAMQQHVAQAALLGVTNFLESMP